ncbi:MAG TPA: prolipoprotein diacylglyceryl transferase [Dehalococcoidia bacterium]|nr:prolipoprotein diacylglyceryl transferase [Dehalococcoidia bacterium]
MSIEIGIDTILFSIGSFEIGWHGIMVSLAVIVGVGVSLWFAKGVGIKKETVYSAAPWAIIGGIIGARLFHVIDYLGSTYISHPAQIFTQFFSGLSILGAILGGTLAVFIYARITHPPLGRLADAIAPALLLAQAVGRIGCTINGDACGTPTSMPWGFVYTSDNAIAPQILAQAGYSPTVATHPSPVYEIMWDILVFALLWRLKGRLKPDGSLFLLYLSLYSFGRFFIEFTRLVTPDQINVFGLLHSPHFITLIVLSVCVPLLIYRIRKARAEAIADPPAEELPYPLP